MPRTGVSRRLSDSVQALGKERPTIGAVLSLAHLYHVSAQAMFLRLEELKRIPSGTWDTLRERRGFKPEQARSALGLAGESRQPMLPLRYRQLALSAYESKEQLNDSSVLLNLLAGDCLHFEPSALARRVVGGLTLFPRQQHPRMGDLLGEGWRRPVLYQAGRLLTNLG